MIAVTGRSPRVRQNHRKLHKRAVFGATDLARSAAFPRPTALRAWWAMAGGSWIYGRGAI